MKNHPALDAALDVFQVEGDSWPMLAMGRAMMRGYHRRWAKSHDDIVLVSCEETYKSDLVNPASGRKSRKLSLAGKIDKVAHQDGVVFFDHKTTSDSIEDPNANYWRQLAVDSQPKMYELLLGQNGVEVDRIVWDVAKKPRLRPRRISGQDAKALVATCEWYGEDVSAGSVEWALEAGNENAELFEARLLFEVVTHHEKYYARRSVPRTTEELIQFAGDLWEVGQRIQRSKKTDGKLRNPGACMHYGRPCQFLGICSGHDRPDSHRWQVKQDVHVELDGEVPDGRDVVTNSRMKCFLQCEAKHYYQYEMGIERVEEERTEALYFGSLWHSAMDAWWAAISGENHGNNAEQPVVEVGTSELAVADHQEGRQTAGPAGDHGQTRGW